MKTRIKTIELNDGTKQYVPEVKKEDVLVAILLNLITLPFLGCVNSLYMDIGKDGKAYFWETDKCSTKEEAQAAIDIYLKNKEHARGKELKKVTYTKYP